MGTVTGCSVAVDASGNVFFLFARLPGEGGPEPGEYAVAKFQSDGTRMWKCVLPKLAYGFPLGGIWRCLTATPDGGAVVGGVLAPNGDGFRGILAGVSAAGELMWFRDRVEDLGHAGSISSVCINAEGVVCAAGDQGYVLLSATGEVIGSGWTTGVTDVAATGLDGGFLLTESRGAILTAVNADGSVR